MKIPFIKYVEALVACKFDGPTINSKIKDLSVALTEVFNEAQISQVYEKISLTNPNYFHSVDELPEADWLRELGVIKMVAYEKSLKIPETVEGIEGAFEILKDPNMYMTMSALALAKINDEDIEIIVNAKYNIHYSSEDIKEFLHYFFDVDDWTVSEKREYIRYVMSKKLRDMYDLAMEGDKDYLIWKLGIAPDKTFDQMLRDMAADTYYNFKENLSRDPDDAQKWGTLMLRLSDRLDKMDKEEEDKRSLFEQLKFSLAGKKEDDLYEQVFDSTGTIVPAKKMGKRHISDVLKEEESEAKEKSDDN